MIRPTNNSNNHNNSYCAKSLQLCPTLCDPTAQSPPGSSVHGIFQAMILEQIGHYLLQEIFLTQGSNPHLLRLLHWQAGSLPLAPPGKPQYLLWASLRLVDVGMWPTVPPFRNAALSWQSSMPVGTALNCLKSMESLGTWVRFGWSFAGAQLVCLILHVPLTCHMSIQDDSTIMSCSGDLSGGSVAKTPPFQCRGPGFHPWSGN